MSQLDAFLRSNVKGYPDPKKEYKIGTPNKALQWIARDDGWKVEAELKMKRPKTDDEEIVVLSRPLPKSK